MRLIPAVLVAAGLAFATVSAASETKAAATPNAAKDKRLVCFAEKATGSHLRKRICMTREEQEQRRKQDQQAMQGLQRSTGAGGAARGRD